MDLCFSSVFSAFFLIRTPYSHFGEWRQFIPRKSSPYGLKKVSLQILCSELSGGAGQNVDSVADTGPPNQSLNWSVRLRPSKLQEISKSEKPLAKYWIN